MDSQSYLEGKEKKFREIAKLNKSNRKKWAGCSQQRRVDSLGKFRFLIFERYHHENPVLNGSPKRDAGDAMQEVRAFTDGMSETQKNEIHACSNSETP